MSPALHILVVSGPNLQLLGTREPSIYGCETLEQIHKRLTERGLEVGVRVDARQSNHEGALCDWIGEARTAPFGGVKKHEGASHGADGILINAGAYTHTSLALFDALKAVGLPAVEVHLSNPEAREEFQHRSLIAAACIGKVAGFGGDSYLHALDALVSWLRKKPA